MKMSGDERAGGKNGVPSRGNDLDFLNCLVLW